MKQGSTMTTSLLTDEKATEENVSTILPVFQDITRVEAIVSSGNDYLVVVSDSVGYVYSLHGISQDTLTNDMLQQDIPGLKLVHTLNRFCDDSSTTSSAIACLCPIDLLHVLIGYADGCILKWNIFDGKMVGKVTLGAVIPLKMAMNPIKNQVYVLCNNSDESVLYTVSLSTAFSNDFASTDSTKDAPSSAKLSAQVGPSPLAFRLGIQAKKLHVTLKGRVLVMDTRSLYEVQLASASLDNKDSAKSTIDSPLKIETAASLNLIYKHERNISAVSFEENVYWLGDVRGQIWRISETEKRGRHKAKKENTLSDTVDQKKLDEKQSVDSNVIPVQHQRRSKVSRTMYHWHADAVQALFLSNGGRLLSGGRENVLVYWRSGGGNLTNINDGSFNKEEDNFDNDLPTVNNNDSDLLQGNGIGSLDTHFRPVGFLPRIAYPTKVSPEHLASTTSQNSQKSGLLWLTGTHHTSGTGFVIIGSGDGYIRIVHQGRVLRILKSLPFVSSAQVFPIFSSYNLSASPISLSSPSSLLLKSAIPGILHHLDLANGHLYEWPIFSRNQADQTRKNSSSLKQDSSLKFGSDIEEDSEGFRVALTRSGGHLATLDVLPDEGFSMLHLYEIYRKKEEIGAEMKVNAIGLMEKNAHERCKSFHLKNLIEKKRLIEFQVYLPNAHHDFKLTITQNLQKDVLVAISGQERVLLYVYPVQQGLNSALVKTNMSGKEDAPKGEDGTASFSHFQTLTVPNLISATFSQDGSLLFCLTSTRLFIYHISSPATTTSSSSFSATLYSVLALPEIHSPRLLICQALLFITHTKGLLIFHILKGILHSFNTTLMPPVIAIRDPDNVLFVILDGKLLILNTSHQNTHQIMHQSDQDVDDPKRFISLIRSIKLPTSMPPIISIYPTIFGLFALNAAHQVVRIHHAALSPYFCDSVNSSNGTMNTLSMAPPLQSVQGSVKTEEHVMNGPIQLPVARATLTVKRVQSSVPMTTTLIPTLSLPSPAELFASLVFTH